MFLNLHVSEFPKLPQKPHSDCFGACHVLLERHAIFPLLDRNWLMGESGLMHPMPLSRFTAVPMHATLSCFYIIFVKGACTVILPVCSC
jgi:hypothetical protein